MKQTITILAFASAMIGCEVSELVDTSAPQPLTGTFQLTDTTGRQTTIFRSGEEFDMSFVLTNSTGKWLTYAGPKPMPIFKITVGDSIVATSVDGYAWVAVSITRYLAPSQTLQEHWRAPNTPAQHPRIVLLPGIYEARTSQVRFGKVAVNQPPPISFSIIQ